MKNPYFVVDNKNLEYWLTLMEYDSIPLLFVCRQGKELWLGLCNSIFNNTNPAKSFRWLLSKTDLSVIRKLIEQKISIASAFKASNEHYLIQQDGNNDSVNKINNIDEELPSSDLFLE